MTRSDTPRVTAPVISVIMPVFNHFDALARTLAGLGAQDGIVPDQLEVILVDNNSTDDGLHDVIATASSTLSVTLIHQPKNVHPFSLCRARNAGLALAQGDWIWTLDADCIPHPRATSALLSAIEEWGRCVIVTGERVFVDAKEVIPAEICSAPLVLEQLPLVASASNYGLVKDRRFPTILDLPHVEHPWDLMHGGNTVFARAAAQAVGGYDERFDGTWGYEDDEFAYRIVSRTSATPVFVPGMTVFHQECPLTDGVGIDRTDKSSNPNWALACRLIPGYRDYKLRTYSKSGINVHV